MDPELIKKIAWAAAVLCCLVSGGFAKYVTSHPPRIFAAFVLFAMSWAVLVPFYDVKHPTHTFLFGVFNGILLTFTGSFLFREATPEGNRSVLPWVRHLETLSLFLLLTTVNPGNLLAIILPINDPEQFRIVIDAWIETIITLSGYFCLWLGLTALVRDSPIRSTIEWSLGILLVVYSAFEVWFAVSTTIAPYNPGYGRVMSEVQMLGFAACKCLLTLSFILIVVWRHAFRIDKPIDRGVEPVAWLIQRTVLLLSKTQLPTIPA